VTVAASLAGLASIVLGVAGTSTLVEPLVAAMEALDGTSPSIPACGLEQLIDELIDR
jgi:hypothetical protein